ncbi:hypothetical protein IQ219_00685 [Synechocystis sp. LEGE 06083]|uniref:hypothetical protein n=1 Tax=Synechocystis sp. LEGE 06083 TaxID=915336 RepID=UPI00188122C4|nr:hypothetical protein [Synechocystis sp. LEGE 06083]MBE9193873.1 hypothetical protein [Synechocystis sp. LEGE 06083]
MNLHYSLFRCQLPDGVVKILNLDAIAQITIYQQNRNLHWVSCLDGDDFQIEASEGDRLVQAWSIHQTAQYASYHAGEFIPNGIPSFPLIKSALLIDTYLADAAHNAHLVPEEE